MDGRISLHGLRTIFVISLVTSVGLSDSCNPVPSHAGQTLYPYSCGSNSLHFPQAKSLSTLPRPEHTQHLTFIFNPLSFPRSGLLAVPGIRKVGSVVSLAVQRVSSALSSSRCLPGRVLIVDYVSWQNPRDRITLNHIRTPIYSITTKISTQINPTDTAPIVSKDRLNRICVSSTPCFGSSSIHA